MDFHNITHHTTSTYGFSWIFMSFHILHLLGISVVTPAPTPHGPKPFETVRFGAKASNDQALGFHSLGMGIGGDR